MTQADREALFVRFSNDVDALMRARGLTIPKLARRADVSEGTVLSMLKAKPCQVQKMVAVIEALGASIAFVVTPQQLPQEKNHIR